LNKVEGRLTGLLLELVTTDEQGECPSTEELILSYSIDYISFIAYQSCT
jgi:hypothetical protein